MMSPSIKQRWQIVFLCCHPAGPKKTIAAAARYLKVTQRVVRHWKKRYEETGTVDDLPGRGRKRVTTEVQDKQIVKMAEGGKVRSATDIVKQMTKKGMLRPLFI
jgi:transposase